MEFGKLEVSEKEKPLEYSVENGGFCGIFRKIACIGDSLASGEFEAMMNGNMCCYDYFDYSWGQYLARDVGCTVYNFSKGSMSARYYYQEYADMMNYWSMDYRAQAYIIALGVNDLYDVKKGNIEFGSIKDIDVHNYRNNKPTFAGFYARIIQRYKEIQPRAKFFLMTMPRGEKDEFSALKDAHAEYLQDVAAIFENCYILDFRKYAPVYDNRFKDIYYLGGHMNAAGYRLTALMVESYIDYIIRHDMDAFKNVGFIGTPYWNETCQKGECEYEADESIDV